MLAEDGWSVELFERREDPRGRETGAGRTINLALSTRGLQGLAKVGLEQEVLGRSVAMRGRQVHCLDQPARFVPYSSDPNNAIYSVGRSLLNRILIDAADGYPNVDITFGASCIELLPSEGITRFEVGGELHQPIAADLILGADGLGSVVREVISAHEPGCSVHLTTFSHGYKELRIPADAAGADRLRRDALHVWPRGSALIVALPNPDGSFNCTFFWNLKGEDSFESRSDSVDLKAALERDYPDLVRLLGDVESQYSGCPPHPLRSVTCSRWETAGRVVLIGDAAHAQLPFFGQGMNTAFEDCVILSRMLEEHDQIETAVRRFSTDRKRDTDAIAMLSKRNFMELSRDVADPDFRFTQRPVSSPLGSEQRTLYEEVTFTTRPYSEVVETFGLVGSD